MFDDDFASGSAAGTANVDPAPSIPATSAGKGVKRKRGKGERGAQCTDMDSSCLAQSCDLPRVLSKRWCCRHNRAWDNLWNQAKRAGETSTLQKATATPEAADKVMAEYDRENPPHSKYARKSVISWGAFKRTHEVSNSTRDRTGCKPFEAKQWLIRCEREMGWSAAEAKAQWAKHLNSSSIDRDYEGLNDALRLWVPCIEERHADRERKKTSAVEEHGEKESRLDEKSDIRDALINFLPAATGNIDDAFLDGKDLAGAADLGLAGEKDNSPVTPKKGETKINVDAPTPTDEKPEDLCPCQSCRNHVSAAIVVLIAYVLLKLYQDPKKAKRLQKISQGPAFIAYKNTAYGKMQQKVSDLQNHVQTAQTKLEGAAEKVQKKMVELQAASSEDSVLQSYEKTLDFALKALKWWRADVAESDCSLPQWSETSVANAEGWRSLTVPGPVQACEHGRHVLAEPSAMQVVQKVEALHCVAYFSWMKASLKDCPYVLMVEAMNAAFKDDVAVVELFIKNLVKMGSDANSYLSQMLRRAEQQEAKKKKEEDKKAVQEATALAKQKAKSVKKGVKGVPAIFQIDATKFAEVAIRENIDQNMDAEAMDAPWVLRGSAAPAVSTWKSSSKIALKLSEFAANYKKSSTFKLDGRAQAPLAPKNGREETEALLSRMIKEDCKLDISSVPGGTDFMATVWHWGADAKLSGAYLAPNCAAMLKLVAMGEIQVVLFELKNVIDVLGSETNCDGLTEALLSLTETSPQWSSFRGVRTVLKADDVLYIPQGWVMCELFGAGILNYGVRKSFLVKTPRAETNYKLAISLLQRSGREPSKMEAVAKCYGDGTAESK